MDMICWSSSLQEMQLSCQSHLASNNRAIAHVLELINGRKASLAKKTPAEPHRGLSSLTIHMHFRHHLRHFLRRSQRD